MRNLLSSLFFILIFVGLGAMAFAAAPRGDMVQNEIAAQPAAPVAEFAAQAEAPRAPTAAKWNMITMPLDSADLNNASDLSAAIPGTQTILHWLPGIQNFDAYPGNDFTLEVGEVYFLLLDSTASSNFTVVGDVPAQGSVQFNMVGASTCEWNIVSLPLDQGDITLASELEASIETAASNSSAVTTILEWLPSIQNFDAYPGHDFATAIGQDYFICLTQNVTWP